MSDRQLNTSVFQLFKTHFSLIIEPHNRSFLYLALIYALAVSLLTLAVPISVQMLVNTVANIASINAIIVLALILLALLLFSGLLIALQSYVLELFERRFYASMTAQFTLRNMQADQQAFRQINGNDLTNRYFDIMQVQKVLPSLISGFFASLLQMLVGIMLVSFYHPWLFLFNVMFVAILWMICRVWGKKAMATAIELSEAKYMTARHLEDVAQSNDFYKSSIRSEHGIARTNKLTSHYLAQRKAHFRNTFSQQIGFLLLYAFASATLLGLGGILVVRAELTLGQLVAAELILSAVFFAISRLSYYLVQFYDLSAALEEISRIYKVKLEEDKGQTLFDASQHQDLLFSKVEAHFGGSRLQLDCRVKAGEKIMIKAPASAIQRCLGDVLRRYRSVESGTIHFNGQDLMDYQASSLRDHVTVIDKTTVIETTILDYMLIHAPHASRAQIYEMLKVVELTELVHDLPDGIESRILANGAPLKSSEILRLKLAAALLAKPAILVLNEHFDSLSYARRQRIFDYVCRCEHMILLYFSNRHDLKMFDHYLFMDWNQHQFFDSVEALRNCDAIDDGGRQ